MDSLTQIALGAAVGEAILGRRVGRKAALWGAICGTLPDLDAFIPWSDPVASFTYHRSFSHSFLVLGLLTPLIVWLIRRIHPADGAPVAGWYALVYGAFATHVLLDSFTIYGTQSLWPLVETPVTWGTVFIIDPLFTLPLVFGVVAIAVLRRKPEAGFRINALMLALSTSYLAWSVAAKAHVHEIARESLAKEQTEYRELVTLAGPFTTVLWRCVAMVENGYLVGWYSLLDPEPEIRFRFYSSEPDLLSAIADHWPVARLRWFTKGFYRVTQDGDYVVMTDLRMGLEGAYAFNFRVGRVGNPHTHPLAAEALPQFRDFARLPDLWARLRGQPVVLE